MGTYESDLTATEDQFVIDYILRHPWRCRKNRKCAKCRRYSRIMAR